MTANFGSDNVSVLLNSCILLDDINHDGSVDQLDVSGFVALLISGVFQVEADINLDSTVNLLDVAPFVGLLMD